MAWGVALVRAMLQVQSRELRSFLSIALNNFFLLPLIVLIGGLSSLQMGGKHPWGSSVPFFLILGFVIILPLSADATNSVPHSRLACWPFSARQKVILRVVVPIINPALWLIILLLLIKAGPLSAFLFFLFGILLIVISILSTVLLNALPPFRPLKHVPRIPGRLGGIVGLAMREIMTTLDFYLALFLSLSGCIWSWHSSHSDGSVARPMIAFLVALALSTYTQVAFGIESSAAMSRYHLFPVRGWRIILAKDLGYLCVLALLVAPLDLPSGLTFGMVSIIIGRYASLRFVRRQQRWRFTSGDLRIGVCQILLGLALGMATARVSILFLIGVALLYVGSIMWGGWLWDRWSDHAHRVGDREPSWTLKLFKKS